jgi:hypothetical protein
VMYWLLRTRPESVTATGDIMLDSYTDEEEPGVVLADPSPK